MGLTQDDLAEKLGVSKQSVYRYESTGRVSLDVVEKLKSLFNISRISEDANISSEPTVGVEFDFPIENLTGLKREVADAFTEIGFKTSITNAPFDMLVSQKQSVFTAVSDDWRRLERKIEIIDDVSEIMGGYSICVTRRRVRGHGNVMKPRELREIKSAREFIKKLTEL